MNCAFRWTFDNDPGYGLVALFFTGGEGFTSPPLRVFSQGCRFVKMIGRARPDCGGWVRRPAKVTSPKTEMSSDFVHYFF